METIGEKRKFHYGFVIVACCCVFSFTSVALIFGCAGIFYTPVCESLGVSRGVFTLSVTLQSLTSGLTIPLVSKLIERFSIKSLVIFDLLLEITCFVAQSFFTKVWMFYITGILTGFVSAFMTSMVATIVLNRWFKVRVGLFLGFSSSMTGISGILINPLAGQFMARFGWEKTYLLYAAIIAVFALPLAVFVFKDDPRLMDLQPYGYEEAAKQAEAGGRNPNEELGVSLEDAVHSRAIVYTVLSMMLLGAVSCFVPFAASYASSLGLPLTVAAAPAGVTQIGTLVGKNTLGAIADKSTRAAHNLESLMSFSGLLIMFSVGASSTLGMQVGAAMFGIIYATTIMNPLLMIQVFGIKNYTKILGVTSIFTSISGAIFSSFWGFLSDFMNGDFTASIILCMIFALAGCLFGNLALSEAKLKRS